MSDISYLNSTMLEMIEKVKNTEDKEELDTIVKKAETVKNLTKQVADNYKLQLDAYKIFQMTPDKRNPLAIGLLGDNE